MGGLLLLCSGASHFETRVCKRRDGGVGPCTLYAGDVHSARMLSVPVAVPASLHASRRDRPSMPALHGGTCRLLLPPRRGRRFALAVRTWHRTPPSPAPCPAVPA